MFTQYKRGLSVLLALAMLMSIGVGAAFAQTATISAGDGPGTAVQPSAGAVTIAPNTWQWYVFRSQVPVNVDSDGNDIVTNPEDATISAMLYTEAANLDFEVWSHNDLNNWINSSDFDPLGQGTENDFMNGDPLFWKGSFQANNNYYLIVQNNSANMATYTLDITGNVRFPTELTLDSAISEMMAPEMMDMPVMSSGEMALTVDTPVAATDAGFGPESALMPAEGSVAIAPNTWQWYSFNSQKPVHVDAEGNDVVNSTDKATIQALLHTEFDNINFEVWSRDDLNNWYNSSDFDALGQGTENEFISGDPLFWQGTFVGNDVYYLIVQNNSGQNATYSLDISGDVTFPTAATLAVQ